MDPNKEFGFMALFPWMDPNKEFGFIALFPWMDPNKEFGFMALFPWIDPNKEFGFIALFPWMDPNKEFGFIALFNPVICGLEGRPNLLPEMGPKSEFGFIDFFDGCFLVIVWKRPFGLMNCFFPLTPQNSGSLFLPLIAKKFVSSSSALFSLACPRSL